MHSFQIEHTPDFARRIYWKLSRERAGGYHIGAVIVAAISIIGTIAGNTPWLFGFGVGVWRRFVFGVGDFFGLGVDAECVPVSSD